MIGHIVLSVHVKVSVMSESYDKTNKSYNVFFFNEIENKSSEQQDDHFSSL